MLKKISGLFILVLFILRGPIGHAQNAISGELKNLPPGNIQLILEEDINRKKSRVIAEIPIDKEGRFHYKGKLSPHIYTLKLTESSIIMLAIDKDQKIEIKGAGADPGSWKVTGSEDTRILMDYESFRKSSLDRLVISVRNKIRDLKERGVSDTDSAIAKLTELEVANYDVHRDELIDYIKTHMGTSLAIYPTSIRWSGEKNISFLADLARKFEAVHLHTDISKK